MSIDGTVEQNETGTLPKITWGRSKVHQVEVVNIDIPFIDLIMLLVKLAIAAIPAAIIVGVIWAVIGGFLFGILSRPF